MQIRDFLMPEGILIGYNAHDKKSVLDMLVELHDRCGNLKNAAAYYEQVLAREEEGTTAVGGATAIPHAQGGAVRRTGLCAMTLQEGVDWGAPDGGPGTTGVFDCLSRPGQRAFVRFVQADYHADEQIGGPRPHPGRKPGGFPGHS